MLSAPKIRCVELRYNYKGHIVEGTPAEIKEFIDANPSAQMPPLDASYDPPRLGHTKIPEIAEIKPYLKQKDNYENSWPDVQMHFIGYRLKSRKDGKPVYDYQLFQTRYQIARKQIEQEEGGKFKQEGDWYKFSK